MQWLRSFFQKSKPESDEWVKLPRPSDSFKRERDEELDRIRELFADRKVRPRLCALCSSSYLSGATMDLLKNSRLDGSKRNRIMCDVIREAAATWKERLVSRFPHLADEWDEHAYEKGLVGELIVLAFQASASAQQIGLTERVLSDILWSIYLGVSRKLPTPLPIEDTELVLGLVIGCAPSIIQAWKKVVEITGSISEREGKVVSQWVKPKAKVVNLVDDSTSKVLTSDQTTDVLVETTYQTFQERRRIVQSLLL